MMKDNNKASLACQARMNIRCNPELSYIELAKIFRGEVSLDMDRYKNHLYGFFEECYPSLIKKFMNEQNITRENIICVFNKLPHRGEKMFFQEVLNNGQF